LVVFALAGLASRWRALLFRVAGWFSPRHRFSPSFARMAWRGVRVSLARYVAAQAGLTDFVETHVAALFGDFDLLATPTSARPPFPHMGLAALGRERVAGEPIDPHIGWLFTWPFNLTGQPAVSVPCGWTEDGLPLGLQIVGRRCADGLVLRAAAALERVQP